MQKIIKKKNEIVFLANFKAHSEKFTRKVHNCKKIEKFQFYQGVLSKQN